MIWKAEISAENIELACRELNECIGHLDFVGVRVLQTVDWEPNDERSIFTVKVKTVVPDAFYWQTPRVDLYGTLRRWGFEPTLED